MDEIVPDKSLIRDRAPAAYLTGPQGFPNGATEAVMDPHFIASEALEDLRRATENLPDAAVIEVFAAFKAARERATVRRTGEDGGPVGVSVRCAHGVGQPGGGGRLGRAPARAEATGCRWSARLL